MDAVAGEDQGGVGDRRTTVIGGRPQGDVGSRRQDMNLTVRAGPAGLGGVGDRREPLQVDDLQPLAVRAARREAHGLVLGLQPVERLLLAVRARIAALEVVGADGADFVRQPLGRKILGCGRTGGEQNGCGGDAVDEPTMHGVSLTLPGAFTQTNRAAPCEAAP
ncbi:hypothetical protein D3C87_1252090 [compost metagenome]